MGSVLVWTSNSFICKLIIVFSMILLCSDSLETSKKCLQRKGVYVSAGKGAENGNCEADHPCTLPTALDKIHKCATITIVDNPFILSDEVTLTSTNSDITITGGAEGVVVQCQGYAGIVNYGCANCSLNNLHFIGCQVNVSSFLNTKAPGLKLNLASHLSSILVFESINFEISNCIFYSCLDSAILLVGANGTTTIENSTFVGNRTCLTGQNSRSGGIVMRHTPKHAYDSIVRVISCNFDGNINISPDFSDSNCHDTNNGGAIDIVISSSEIQVFILITESKFVNNSACGGGALQLLFYGKNLNLSTSIVNSLFDNNFGFYKGGAVVFSFYAFHIGYENNKFSGKLRSYGKFLIQSCEFRENLASWSGALAAYSVPCDRCENNIDIEITDTEWINNVANQSGFAIGLSGVFDPQRRYNITAYFTGNCTLYRNHLGGDDYSSIGAISVETAIVRFGGDGVTIFDSNFGTALLLRSSSSAIFEGRVVFSNNSGVLGGAILVQSESHILIKAYSDITFTNNYALVYGGALYSNVNNAHSCVIEFDSELFPNNTEVTFINNTSPGLQQAVFIQTSKPCKECKVTVLDLFKFIPHDHFQIVFPPDEVTLDVLPQPSQGNVPEIILGEPFYLDPVSISDIFNTSSTGVGFMYYDQLGSHEKILAIHGPKTINFDSFTKNIKFSVVGPDVTSAINISIYFFFPKQSSYHVGINTVKISVVPCRSGYVYSDQLQKCVCVGSQEIRCLQDSSQLCLKYHYWYSDQSKLAYPCPRTYCQYMHQQCPPNTKNCLNSTDYCIIEKSSDVCWDGRAGTLCSECKEHLSYTLGAYKCADTKTTCNSKNTFLLTMLVILYWTLYAAVLLAILSLQLSVGSGFMYGLVYYFSVVTIYTSGSALFGDPWVFFVVIICEALTQLNCFTLIAQMLPYCFSSSWTTPLPHMLFQYAGPIFLIALMLLAVLVSRFCRLPKKLRLSQSSPIHAICLLILFCYTSISSTNFKLLLPINVDNQWRVQIAPSVGYFSPTHAPYALVAIVVELTISLPICFLLLFAPFISKHVDLVKYKLKPIVDEFHACYRTDCRWFAGFYFLVRQLVYLINGLFSETEPQENTLLVLLNVLIWTIHTTFQPYRKKWLNVLDTILLTDLVLISSSVAGQSVDLKKPINIFIHQNVLPYVLILVPLCYLCGAVVFIIGQKLGIGRCLTKLWDKYHWRKHSTETVTTSTEINAKAKWDDSYYRDNGIREPLLDESFQPDSLRSSSKSIHYDSVEDSDRNQTQSAKNSTSSSVRVSQMNSFPPQQA